jgi:hypothetical protein
MDNDSAPAATNPDDDSRFFVRQHYLDFLGREPDDGGLNYWSSQLANCGADAACIKQQRTAVSAAFFIETEFQETGSFVYRMYKASYGRQPNYAEFMPDRSRVVAGTDLEANKQAFADQWVLRDAFRIAYPDFMTPDDFVNKLFGKAGLATDASAQALAADLRAGTKTRAQVLRAIIDRQDFRGREYNPSFVLMQYFGYLRRDPEQGGYDFWLNVLDNKVPGNYRGMVCAFITSAEYQDRFNSTRTHNDSECR